MIRRLAIIQGRLLPPIDSRIQRFPGATWVDEFPRARAAGLDAIEWIYEMANEAANPVATDAGIARLRTLQEEHGVVVHSLCADCYMERPLLRGSDVERLERRAHLEWLLGRCAEAEIERVVLPFVDQSRLEGEADRNALVALLNQVLPHAEAVNVELHVETALDPDAFAALLAAVPHPFLRVNYDSGNSASLGYRVQEEFAAYGDRIGSVHVKDRVRGGGTVPLGLGDADLPALFGGLRALDYGGDLVLQVARGEAGQEVEWARQNVAVIKLLLQGAWT